MTTLTLNGRTYRTQPAERDKYGRSFARIIIDGERETVGVVVKLPKSYTENATYNPQGHTHMGTNWIARPGHGVGAITTNTHGRRAAVAEVAYQHELHLASTPANVTR